MSVNWQAKRETFQESLALTQSHVHSCRHQSESKTRKYLANVIWLLTYDDPRHSLIDALEKYAVCVPWHHWLHQLLDADRQCHDELVELGWSHL